MTEQMRDKQRFFELLPLYLNETLDPDDQAFMEQYIRKHPETLNLLRFEQALKEAVGEDPFPRAEDEGLSALLDRLDGNASPRNGRRAGSPAWQWLSNWGLTPAFAIAAAVVVAQAGLLLGIWGGTDPAQPTFSEFRDIPTDRSPVYPVLAVSFSPRADIASITENLALHGLVMISGPSPDGYYVLGSTSRGLDDGAAARLRASGLVDDMIDLPADEPCFCRP